MCEGCRQGDQSLAAGLCMPAIDLADSVTAMWQRVDGALAPLVGSAFVDWLYGQSLGAARQAHPWLPDSSRSEEICMDLAALGARLRQQPMQNVFERVALMLDNFKDLMHQLLGRGTTALLLEPVSAFFA